MCFYRHLIVYQYQSYSLRISASSLGRLLKNRGLKVTMQKFDPYINIDPGTMNPYQHGEVYVTDDGTEAERSHPEDSPTQEVMITAVRT